MLAPITRNKVLLRLGLRRVLVPHPIETLIHVLSLDRLRKPLVTDDTLKVLRSFAHMLVVLAEEDQLFAPLTGHVRLFLLL